jgi:hydroxymethylglutaryl-CoA reductase
MPTVDKSFATSGISGYSETLGICLNLLGVKEGKAFAGVDDGLELGQNLRVSCALHCYKILEDETNYLPVNR